MRQVDLAYVVGGGKEVAGEAVLDPASYRHSDIDAALRVLAKKYGGVELGSGSGFGARDIQFEFPTQRRAESFIVKAERLPVFYEYVDLCEGY